MVEKNEDFLYFEHDILYKIGLKFDEGVEGIESAVIPLTGWLQAARWRSELSNKVPFQYLKRLISCKPLNFDQLCFS